MYYFKYMVSLGLSLGKSLEKPPLTQCVCLPSLIQLSHHHLSSVLVGYTIPPPSDLGLPLDHSLPLSTTALLTWALALGYGLASQAVR